MEPRPASPTGVGGVSCWSKVLQKAVPPLKPEDVVSGRVFGSCGSSKGVSVAVVDASSIVHGAKMASTSDRFVSVREVLEEVRDPVSRQRLSFMPFPIETMEPTPDAIRKVVQFARETGDLQTLSDVDVKLIALTYMLEAQIHGTSHLRSCPRPLQIVNVKNLPESEMPGWGSNVPNLAEWEALEQAEDNESNHGSRILHLKDLNLDVPPANDASSKSEEQEDKDQSSQKPKIFPPSKKEINVDGKKMVASGIDASQGEDRDNVDNESNHGSRIHLKDLNLDVPPANDASSKSEEQEDKDQSSQKPKRFPPSKKEINIDGKKMVASGIDASQGEDRDNVDDWRPAVSRSTHRRYLRRKARRELLEASKEVDRAGLEASEVDTIVEGMDVVSDSKSGFINVDMHISPGEAEPDECIALEEKEIDFSFAAGSDDTTVDASLNSMDTTDLANGHGPCSRVFEDIEISSETDRSIDTPVDDDNTVEERCKLQSMSNSSVACMTSDFAMQNVILQMGLRLLAPGGMQIRQMHRWVLKCHACNKVTTEIGRIFCPKCGNGGTLRKVSVTVGENGQVLASRRSRFNLRGTKFSIPLPQGGRDAISRNFVLREDQLPQKLLYPKQKKKNNKQEDFFGEDDIFSHASGKRAPLKPPVGKAVLVFTGKRNLNDNHFSRRH